VQTNTVKRESGCHEFVGCRNHDGYGRINKEGRLVYVHRAVWENANGKIPFGMFICHKCDNPSCVNPEHLFLGTHADNMKDKALKGRVTNAIGSKNPSAKLKDADIPVIRSRILAGETCYSIARDYGVIGEAILHIKHNRRWSHIA
jgi:hypothetical protein